MGDSVKNLLMPAWLPLAFPTATLQIMDDSSTPWWISFLTTILGQDPVSLVGSLTQDPATLFYTLLVSLVSVTVFVRVLQFQSQSTTSKDTPQNLDNSSNNNKSNQKLRFLQWKFLSVFWLLRTSFWMSGPYFYAAYALKTNGDASLISQISLAGYASIALFGPFLGTFTDRYGRKLGTLLAVVLYGLGSLSTMATPLWALFLGRALGGVGTSLLSAAPEAWLVSEFNQVQQESCKDDDSKNANNKPNPAFLQQTFGVAYAYDPVVAIGAGQLAGLAASMTGPTGPFQVSPVFLAMGGFLAAVFWKENRAKTTKSDGNTDEHQEQKQQSIWDAVAVIRNDTKIVFLGGVQAFFEGAMYIFVMQWPPTMNWAIQQSFGSSAITPYGTAFSCFMACCMAGSTVFGILSKSNQSSSTSTSIVPMSLEGRTVVLLGLSFLAMVAATTAVATKSADNSTRGLWQLIVAYFIFEACVGMYFPSIGTLRSKYLPDSHRSVIMTLFGVPLNIIVVTVFLLVHKLGDVGALGVAALALGLATACMVGLYVADRRIRKKQQVRDRFKKMVRKVQIIMDISDSFREELTKRKTERAIQEAVEENRNCFSTFNWPKFH